MAFPQPQQDAIFQQRTQRFLALMELADGTKELVYCANPGAMASDLSSGARALIWESGDLKRKRRFTWRAVETEGLWIGTDTHLSNRIVEEALRLRLIPSLENYETIAREYNVEPGVRVDFLVSGSNGECLIEVKSCNIVENGVARYPDSATPRGVKQLKSLTLKASTGQRSILLFLVQRDDAQSFKVSTINDPAYAQAFVAAIAAGVEVIVVAVSVHPEGFGKPRVIPHNLEIDEATEALLEL